MTGPVFGHPAIGQPIIFNQPGKTEQDEAAAAEDRAAQDVELQADIEAKRILARKLGQERADEIAAEGQSLSWVQVDHDIAFAMSRERVMPDIGHMVDAPTVGHPPLPLLYTGKINGVHGDSEAGKSWLAQFICVQEMQAGRHVLYLDFEDDAGGVYQRLMVLGAGEAMIREFFHYVCPDSKLTVFEKLSYASLINMEGQKSIAVVDGVTEAMALEALTGRDEGEVARWHQLVTKPLAAANWGPFMIDHMPHEAGRVIGSQHKKAAITGVSYELESINQFAKGTKGRSRLYVAKDRPGGVRQEAAPGKPQWYGDFVMSEYGEAGVWAWLKPRTEEEEIDRELEPDVNLQRKILRFVEKNAGCSGRSVRGYIKGRPERVLHELERLVQLGHLTTEDGPRNSKLHYFDHGLD